MDRIIDKSALLHAEYTPNCTHIQLQYIATQLYSVHYAPQVHHMDRIIYIRSLLHTSCTAHRWHTTNGLRSVHPSLTRNRCHQMDNGRCWHIVHSGQNSPPVCAVALEFHGAPQWDTCSRGGHVAVTTYIQSTRDTECTQWCPAVGHTIGAIVHTCPIFSTLSELRSVHPSLTRNRCHQMWSTDGIPQVCNTHRLYTIQYTNCTTPNTHSF